MKRFAFRLERLLRLRLSAEREQSRVVAEARQDAETRRRAHQKQSEREGAAQTALSTAASAATPAGALLNLASSRDALAADADAARVAADEAEDRAAREVLGLKRARAARRVLERLREKRRERWQDDVNRSEQRQLDEVAQRRVRAAEETQE